jgi:GNAT superfamily N-acetyltransferase
MSPKLSLTIQPLRAQDRAAWGRLAAGYKAFYKTPTTEAEYEQTWLKLTNNQGAHALGAYRQPAPLDAAPAAAAGAGAELELVGITHYLFHTSPWGEGPYFACYLQDLFTDAACRGQGVARALIEAVAAQARQRQSQRLYWLTQDHNHTARALYDKVAVNKGFLRYDYALA